jgi:hypothetical protein
MGSIIALTTMILLIVTSIVTLASRGPVFHIKIEEHRSKWLKGNMRSMLTN